MKSIFSPITDCFTNPRLFNTYLDSYRGLSKPTWMLAVVMLINRTGAMVLPFLGIYMTTQLGFTLNEVGFVLGCFGVGAVLGSVTGGWLTDKFGHFKVQATSLLLAVPVFLILFYLRSVVSLSLGIFSLSLITEIFRPANSVSISHYTKPENITRAFSLNRMALNLGFSIGPAMGGFLAAVSYHLLFYGNAFSTGVAGIVFYFYFRRRERLRERRRKIAEQRNKKQPGGPSPWRDTPFVVFSVLCLLFSICFYQLLNTLPLYYKEVYLLKDRDIGLLLAFNGIVVFALEMFIVSTSERVFTIQKVIVLGLIFCALCFWILLAGHHLFILYLSVFFLSISEMLAMPFMATVAIDRAPKGKEGVYMGLNSLSFSAAHIISPILGTAIAARFGFNNLWLFTGVLALAVATGLWFNLGRMKLEKKVLKK